MKKLGCPFLLLFSLTACQDLTVSESTLSQSQEVASVASAVTGEEPVPFNVAGAPIVALSVPNMFCESCVAKTTEILSKQPGVVELQVDLEAKRIDLVVENPTFDSEAVLSVLEDYGFTDSSLIAK